MSKRALVSFSVEASADPFGCGKKMVASLLFFMFVHTDSSDSLIEPGGQSETLAFLGFFAAQIFCGVEILTQDRTVAPGKELFLYTGCQGSDGQLSKDLMMSA